MTLTISDQPFTDNNPHQWLRAGLGPAWFTIDPTGRPRTAWLDIPACTGLHRFVAAVAAMAPRSSRYGTVYGLWHDGRPVADGEWHVDTGDPDQAGADRYTSTWTSDGDQRGNVFLLDNLGREVQAPNLHIARFNEGLDVHRRPGAPARPGAHGVFLSASVYRDGEPANLGCPRLAPLRRRGPYAALAAGSKPVARDWERATDWDRALAPRG